MGKRGKGQNDNRNPKRRARVEDVAAEDMDDEIDAFHKQRDVIPLDINGDVGESDEDNEQPVFDFEDINDDEDDDDDINDDTQLTGLAAKIARQQKFLRAKMGGVEDEMHDDAEDEEEKRAVWGRRKNIYYSADNVDFELQSSDEEPAEEEAEVLRLQREKAMSLSMEDFGLEDVNQDDSDGEPTLEEILIKGKAASKPSAEKDAEDATGTAYVEVKKDLDSLSREEKMDVVYSSAPELVGLLSELNDALEQLESKVNPLLSKIKQGENTMKGGTHYLEMKQLLLLAYCQAITFYLLLKSEGEPVRDHPVIARLVEIKNLLDKMKQLDDNLPSELEEILYKNHGAETVAKLVRENSILASDSFTKNHEPSLVSAEAQGAAVPQDPVELVKVDSSKDCEDKGEKIKRKNDRVGVQSIEMLKVRAALEEKLKQKGIFSSITAKPDRAQKHHLQPVNGQLETLDDFDDDAMDMEGGTRGLSKGHANSSRSNKLSQLVTTVKVNKLKVVSGDDDLPMRDDIGERRRKHELQVLAGAGIKSEDDIGDELGILGTDGDAEMEEDGETEESEDEFYKQVKQQRAAKLAAKAEIYSRTSAVPSLAETLVDGKRQITQQMEKNRGLTRARKKLTKNPRKKYKLKHQKAVVRRKGQVREIKKPSGPYGGETSGINARISRSIRFKN